MIVYVCDFYFNLVKLFEIMNLSCPSNKSIFQLYSSYITIVIFKICVNDLIIKTILYRYKYGYETDQNILQQDCKLAKTYTLDKIVAFVSVIQL